MTFLKIARSGGAAFTLIEIMIVVAIIALLAAIAVPSMLHAREQTRRTRLVENLRVLRDAFETYAAEHASYPPESGPGEVPAGMASYLGSKVNMAAPTPMGGLWDWDLNVQDGIRACISIAVPNASLEEMRQVDAMLDDGDLTTGAFRSPRHTIYSYVIED